MDKGGDEHLVALQRLEEALTALAHQATAAQEFLLRRRFSSQMKHALKGHLQFAETLSGEILTLKPHWPGLEPGLWQECIECAEHTTTILSRFNAVSEQKRAPGPFDIEGVIAQIPKPIDSLSSIRDRLVSLRIRSLFPNESSPVDASVNHTNVSGDDKVDLGKGNSVRALHLADEMESQAHTLLDGHRKSSPFTGTPILSEAVVFSSSLLAITISRLSPNRGSMSDALFAIALVTAALSLPSIVRDLVFRAKTSKAVKARARLLLAASSQIKANQGVITSTPTLDIIEFALRHRHDETDYKTFDLKTEELKALIADTPPSGPTAIATQ